MDEAKLKRAWRSLEGLALGDAMGQSVAGDAPLPDAPWKWSDDTVMAFSVVEELLEHGRIDQDALIRRFGERFREDPWRGYGAGASRLLTRIVDGEAWRAAAQASFGGKGSMGNGAAMRVAPLGAYFSEELARVVEEAALSAAVTHAHPQGIAGAVAIAVAAALRSSSRCPGFTEFLDVIIAHTPKGAVLDGLLDAKRLEHALPEHAALGLGDGSNVVAQDSVPLAIWCAAHHPSDFEGAMKTASLALAAPSSDRDTIMAMVGGIVAAHPDALVPPSWIAAREPLPKLRNAGAA